VSYKNFSTSRITHLRIITSDYTSQMNNRKLVSYYYIWFYN